MAQCCRTLAARGLIAGRDGNVTVRVSRDRALVTPAGVLKALLQPGDMVEVDLAGVKRRGRRNPTSELDLHPGSCGAAPTSGPWSMPIRRSPPLLRWRGRPPIPWP